MRGPTEDCILGPIFFFIQQRHYQCHQFQRDIYADSTTIFSSLDCKSYMFFKLKFVIALENDSQSGEECLVNANVSKTKLPYINQHREAFFLPLT